MPEVRKNFDEAWPRAGRQHAGRIHCDHPERNARMAKVIKEAGIKLGN